jgi:tetratricopeptide (TPR) repeat protein
MLKKWWLLGLMALAVVAFWLWPVTQGALLDWDDSQQVLYNKDIRVLSVGNVQKIFSSFYIAMYQPLPTLSYALEYHFVGLKPWLYHVDNLLLHLLNIILVFWLTWLLYRKRLVAAVSAGLFALWPTQMEVVAWVSCRSTLLASAFMLGALITLLIYWQQRKTWQLPALYALAVLAMLSKVVAVVLLPLAIILAFRQKKMSKNTLYQLAPLAIVAVLIVVVAMVGRQFQGVQAYQFFSWLNYLAIAGYSFVWQVGKLLWPFNLSHYYSIPVILLELPGYVYAWATVGGLLLAASALAWWRGRGFWPAWFIINVFLSVLVTPYNLQTGADRYNYLAMLALAWPLALFVNYLYEKKRRWVLVVVALAALGLVVYDRQVIARWQSDKNLWRNAVLVNPSLSAPWWSLGMVDAEQGNWAKAGQEADLAILNNPFDAHAYLLRGRAKFLGQNNLISASKDFQKAILFDAKARDAYYYLALVEMRLGRSQSAKQALTQAIMLNSVLAPADQGNLANAYMMLGMIYQKQSKMPAAEKAFAWSLASNQQLKKEDLVNYSAALMMRAMILQNSGKKAEACALFQQAAERGQKDAERALKSCKVK